MGGGAARGAQDVSQIPRHFQKPFPSSQGGGPGSRDTSSPQAAGWGWGQGCVVVSGEGTGDVRDPELSQTARNSPPGSRICL